VLSSTHDYPSLEILHLIQQENKASHEFNIHNGMPSLFGVLFAQSQLLIADDLILNNDVDVSKFPMISDKQYGLKMITPANISGG
jgi:hypothetical protein